MTPALTVLHSISPAIGDLFVSSMWQSLLLTGAVALCLQLIRGITPSTRSSLWTGLLALILLLPAITVLMPRIGAGNSHALHVENYWSLGLVSLWFVLSAFRAVQLYLSARRLRTLVREATRIEPDPAFTPLLEAGSRRALLCVSEQIDRPGLVGFFRPRILLPAGLLESLSQPEIEQIVLHEMEHLRRRDDWANLLQQVSLVLLPWNPAVLWLNRRLSLERELACDDAVMHATKARKSYAACLVRLAEDSMLRRGISLTLSALGRFESRARKSDLVKRVRRILAAPEPRKRRGYLRAVTALVFVGTLGVSVLLVRSPQLVDFTSLPATVAAAPSDAAVLPARDTTRAHPVMVKAIMPGVNPHQALATRTALHKQRVLRRRTPRAFSEPAPTIEMTWHSRVPVSRAVITLTSTQDSQKLYAAVPWQDGWLLIQL